MMSHWSLCHLPPAFASFSSPQFNVASKQKAINMQLSRTPALSTSRPGATRLGAPPRQRVSCAQSRTLLRPCQASKDTDAADLSAILAKYNSPSASQQQGGASSAPPSSKALAKPLPQPTTSADASTQSLFRVSKGLALLLAANCAVYGLAVWGGKATTVAGMVLSASGGKWWQYISSAFVHATWDHLVRNLVAVWLSGTLLRKELTNVGVWITYIFCGVGANMAAAWLMPASTKAAGGLLGVGATGAAMGLALTALALGARFSISYLVAAFLYWHLLINPMIVTPVPGGPSAAKPLVHNLSEFLFAGPSGLPAVLKAVKNQLTSVTADPGLTWFWGALAAAVLVVVIARFPDPDAQTATSS